MDIITHALQNVLLPSTHSLGSEKDIAFEMIGDNYTQSLGQLDSVRARQTKFICINDNIQNPTPELENALRDFYLSFFPLPSQFELPDGVRNPSLYRDELDALKAKTGKDVKAGQVGGHSHTESSSFTITGSILGALLSLLVRLLSLFKLLLWPVDALLDFIRSFLTSCLIAMIKILNPHANLRSSRRAGEMAFSNPSASANSEEHGLVTMLESLQEELKALPQGGRGINGEHTHTYALDSATASDYFEDGIYGDSSRNFDFIDAILACALVWGFLRLTKAIRSASASASASMSSIGGGHTEEGGEEDDDEEEEEVAVVVDPRKGRARERGRRRLS
jgi:hypothetical protein